MNRDMVSLHVSVKPEVGLAVLQKKKPHKSFMHIYIRILMLRCWTFSGQKSKREKEKEEERWGGDE